MPLPDALFLKQQFQRCNDKPLDPGDSNYEPLYEADPEEDPVEGMARTIRFQEVHSVQYFSGFSGAGKTTQLNRLKQNLEKDGYRVFYASAHDYLDLSSPLQITELLLVLAGAFSDCLEERGYADIKKDPFHKRVVKFIKSVGIDISSALELTDELFGSKLGKLKLTLRNEPTFRDQLRTLLANRLSEFKGTVDKFFEDGLKAIRKADGPDRRVVFLFDQLEQLRGSLSNHAAVMDSVQSLFRTHSDKLSILHIHLVCTVPPWLRFVVPGIKTTMLTGIRLWENKTARPPRQKGLDQMRRILARRFPGDDMARFFGPPDRHGHHPAAERLISASSGVLRDLFRLVRQTIIVAHSLPVNDATITAAISDLRNDYRIFASSDARWLHTVATERETAAEIGDPASIERFTRFVEQHAVLIFSNGDHWYDLHTLVREDVARIVARAKPKRAPAKKKPTA